MLRQGRRVKRSFCLVKFLPFADPDAKKDLALECLLYFAEGDF